jgi:TRAP-type uncharacterized transport system fused permease subunit
VADEFGVAGARVAYAHTLTFHLGHLIGGAVLEHEPPVLERLPHAPHKTRKAEELIEKYESPVRRLSGPAAWVAWALCLAISLYALYGALGTPNTHVFRVAHMTLVLMATLLLYPWGTRDKSAVPLLDWLLVATVALAYLNFIWDFEEFIYRAVTPTTLDLGCGILTILIVLEATRRTTGWVLPALVLACLAYALIPGFLPGLWAHKGYDLERIVGRMSSEARKKSTVSGKGRFL